MYKKTRKKTCSLFTTVYSGGGRRRRRESVSVVCSVPIWQLFFPGCKIVSPGPQWVIILWKAFAHLTVETISRHQVSELLTSRCNGCVPGFESSISCVEFNVFGRAGHPRHDLRQRVTVSVTRRQKIDVSALKQVFRAGIFIIGIFFTNASKKHDTWCKTAMTREKKDEKTPRWGVGKSAWRGDASTRIWHVPSTGVKSSVAAPTSEQ